MSDVSDMDAALTGEASDDTPGILATGNGDIATLFVSMAQRHPDKRDAEYLRWHTLDHRPEQQRLAAIRTSLRAVSTPACRAARIVSDSVLDQIDHVQIYFMSSIDGLQEFSDLSIALRDAGRTPFVLPPVQRGVYQVAQRSAAQRIKIGADVLPWLPIKGVFILLEEGQPEYSDFTSVAGVAGVWAANVSSSAFGSVVENQRFTLCFLDDDPVSVARRLDKVLEQRWSKAALQPRLAAPFYCVVPYEWDRYLP